MEWNTQQVGALEGVARWMRAGGQGCYRLFGYAGTGKTTLAKHFAAGLDGTVVYGAYTGKAASVLQAKGCMGATTIHKLIYKPAEKNKENLNRLRKEYDDLVAVLKAEGKGPADIEIDPRVVKLHKELKEEQSKHRRPSFTKNEESAIKDAALVIIDEVSMVDEPTGEDLMSFEVPILVLGDPFQLPPVRGCGYFTQHQPDTLLTDVRRQEADSPVLRLATDVRQGRSLRHGVYGDTKVIPWAQVDRGEVMAADQILVGTNRLRFQMNARCRELLGRPAGVPVAVDRVVCLRNNHELGLLNGVQSIIEAAVQVDDQEFDLCVKQESGETLTCPAHSHYFRGEEPPFWDVRDRESFDFSFAMTTHKAQGSQFDRPYIFDESKVFRQDGRKWLYTAITRAAKSAVIVTD